MLYFVSGPIDKDYSGGIIREWHLETFNNSNCNVTVNLKVFNIDGSSPVMIGDTNRVVYPHTHQYMSLSTNSSEHSIAQIEYPESGSCNILLTLYGRDKIGNAVPGAIFSNNQLTELSQGIIA